jgi:peptidoglycan/xylan/chitin deacetylase (PgdA/CDA1 family)
MLPSLDRFPYSPIRERPDFTWPGGKRVAVHIAINLEHFIFGGGGVNLDRDTAPPNHRSYLWREYGNRVGIWRLLDLFDELEIPMGVIANSAIYEHCPDVMDAFRARGDEVIGHGKTNSKPQSEMEEAEESAMIAEATKIISDAEGAMPLGWLSPYLMPSSVTPDLLKEAGYTYFLDWGLCDDQPFWSRTRAGPLLSVPYTIELNDQPAMIYRRDRPRDFAEMSIDHVDEHIRGAKSFSTVCVISLHSFIVGQPFRLGHLRRVLEHIQTRKSEIWLTRPGDIAKHYMALPDEVQLKAE